MINSTPKQQPFDSRTITKKKGLQLSTIKRAFDSSILQQQQDTLLHKSNDNLNNQYEDITDVRVIAKMQEETLRQSVMNINKSKSLGGSMNSLVNYQLTTTPMIQTNNNINNKLSNAKNINNKKLPTSTISNINNTNSQNYIKKFGILN